MIFTPEISKLFEDVGQIFGEQMRPAQSHIAVNIWSQEDEVVVQAELPGVQAKDIEIEVLKDMLHLKASRHFNKPDGAQAHLTESSDCTLERKVRLPFEVNAGTTKAEFKDGLLSVHLQRSVEDKPHRVPVDIL